MPARGVGAARARGHPPGVGDDAAALREHERVGGEYLRSLGFSSTVAHLVGAHVDAKRYLCYRKVGYFERLSTASRQTLEWQGGPMDHHEALAFEADPWFETILGMRMFDERAKLVNAKVPDLESYRPMIVCHLREEAQETPHVKLTA